MLTVAFTFVKGENNNNYLFADNLYFVMFFLTFLCLLGMYQKNCRHK
ncbi:hypothetical protein XBO1_470004 [Xenorhabdus bovienii str. oregonense]|uniref:Uncharacterized protein n=1 Tax=Xenorhabdus bovienii str. oregonense TaxID=1398202 RepID=A0A077P933_XENBV|nr:hypothetical protein XBO1_470004 [Xenorhabdus bovienii str. oregonense]